MVLDRRTVTLHYHSRHPNAADTAELPEYRYFCFKYLDNKVEEFFTKPEDGNDEHALLKFRRYQCLRIPCRVLVFLAINFMAVWSFGSGSFGIEMIAILGFLFPTTVNVTDAKVSNLRLNDPPNVEMSWGFGQVMPIVLLVMIVFSALGVAGNVSDEAEE